jgi:hypothetical protein
MMELEQQVLAKQMQVSQEAEQMMELEVLAKQMQVPQMSEQMMELQVSVQKMQLWNIAQLVVHLKIVLEVMSSELRDTAMELDRCRVQVQKDLLKVLEDIHTQGKVPMRIAMRRRGAQ